MRCIGEVRTLKKNRTVGLSESYVQTFYEHEVQDRNQEAACEYCIWQNNDLGF